MDIRKVGSGNIGATNVLPHPRQNRRHLVLLGGRRSKAGSPSSYAPGLADWFSPGRRPRRDRSISQIFAGIAAILGHNYTCWLRFKGGKGIATSAGVLAALVPDPLHHHPERLHRRFAAQRYVSARFHAAALHPAFRHLDRGRQPPHDPRHRRMALLAIYKHKANIERLLTEPKLGKIGRPNRPPRTSPEPCRP